MKVTRLNANVHMSASCLPDSDYFVYSSTHVKRQTLFVGIVRVVLCRGSLVNFDNVLGVEAGWFITTRILCLQFCPSFLSLIQIYVTKPLV